MSTVSESNPWWAMTSAENELGIDSQPFTTASPRAQIFLNVFSLTTFSCLLGEGGSASRELRTAHCPEVAPPADPQILGLFEVGDRRDVGGGIDEVRLHRTDREAELLLDGLEPLVAPSELCHLRLRQIRLKQLDLRGRHPEHLGGRERVAAELERRPVRRRASRLPVHEREPPVVRPEAEGGRHPDRGALELEARGPVLDRPVLGRRLADGRQEREAEEIAQADR